MRAAQASRCAEAVQRCAVLHALVCLLMHSEEAFGAPLNPALLH
jgi:hypothetical protein